MRRTTSPTLLRKSTLSIAITLACLQLAQATHADDTHTKPKTCHPSPLGPTALYLRGSMNNWAALDDYQFTYDCDAYYLNVNVTSRQDFKISDAQWSEHLSFGAPHLGIPSREAAEPKPGQNYVLADQASGADNLNFPFNGDHTVRLQVLAGSSAAALSIGPKSFIDPDNRPVSDPIALSAHYNSRLESDKLPYGAITSGTTVNFRFHAAPGISAVTLVIEKRKLEGNQETLDYAEVARVPLKRLIEKGHDQAWEANYHFGDISVYGYYFEYQVGGKTFIYQNNGDPIFWTREKGSDGLGSVSEKPANLRRIRRYRQTVYSPDFSVPEWSRDAVYYYIFPERFRNGDKSNDPKVGVDTYQDQAVEVHKNWLEKPFRPGTNDGSDNVYCNDFFGGDIAGIIEKLDYIKSLGANTLYITPMFRAASNHKYDTIDYKNIDPHFGSNEDFIHLTREAEKRGIRVIPDTSLNHTGSDSLYFDRYAKYDSHGAFRGAKVQPDSPYADWYRFDTSKSDPDKQYTGWIGVQDLPEIDKSSPSFRQYVYGADDSVMKIWLDRGAAGWRMDVAPWVPDDFWREWRKAIKAHKPDALTIAETYFDASKFLLGDEFDTTMNYIFSNTVQAYAGGGDARALYQNIELMREEYPQQSFYALMNLLSSHDVPRALYQFGYLDEDSSANAITLAKRRLRLAAFFQMTFPGAPAIYYGDEVGVTGGEDPYNRATYPWADQGGHPDTNLLAGYRKLTQLRADYPILRHGSLSSPLLLDEHLIVLLRRDDKQWAITATNNSGQARQVKIQLPKEVDAKRFREVLSGQTYAVQGNTLSLTVPALFGNVLISQ